MHYLQKAASKHGSIILYAQRFVNVLIPLFISQFDFMSSILLKSCRIMVYNIKRESNVEVFCMSNNELKFHVFCDERFVDLNLYQFGYEKCQPLHSYGPYARNHYLFHYVISGKGCLHAKKHYDVTAGHGFIIEPNQITTYFADENDPWEYAWIEFDGLRVRESLQLAGLGSDQPIYTPTNAKDGALLLNEIMYIVHNGTSRPMSIVGHAFIFLDQLIYSSATKMQRTGKRLRDFYMKEALSFIEQNYQNDISIEDIASFCGLNRNYFGKIFRNTMGKTPQEFLLSYRMAKAAQLLKETTLSIAAISSMVSYQNPLHFSRAFKNIYGCSPRQYRQS